MFWVMWDSWKIDKVNQKSANDALMAQKTGGIIIYRYMQAFGKFIFWIQHFHKRRKKCKKTF